MAESNNKKVVWNYASLPIPVLKPDLPEPKSNILYSIENVVNVSQNVFEFSQINESRYKRIKNTGLATNYFYPHLTDKNKFIITIKYMMLYFVFDDQTESFWGDVANSQQNAVNIWTQLKSALNKLISAEFIPSIDWKPYVLSMYAVFEDVIKEFNECQKKRFVDVWNGYIDGNIEEVSIIDAKQFNEFTTDEDYIQVRLKTGAILTVLQWLEYCNGISLLDHEWNDPELFDLIKKAAKYILYINDLYSFERELEQNENDVIRFSNKNMLALIAVRDQITIEEAINKLIKVINERETDYNEAEKAFLEKSARSEDLKALVRGIRDFVVGNYNFSIMSDRYKMKNISNDFNVNHHI